MELALPEIPRISFEWITCISFIFMCYNHFKQSDTYSRFGNMSDRDLSTKEALLSQSSPTSTLEVGPPVACPTNVFSIPPPGNEIQARERASTDQSAKTVNRRTKASRWRKFHRDPAHLIPHNSPSILPTGKSIRQRWYSKFKRDYTSATNVSYLDRMDQNNSDQRQLSRIRSFRKLQRGTVVVQSDTNSRNSCGSVSKNYSLDSTKSDGLLNKTISVVGDQTTHTSPEAPLEHYLPALTLTVPAEDLLPATNLSLESGLKFKATDQFSNQFSRLCDYCALSQPSVYTSLLDSQNEANSSVLRRHSHCGCSAPVSEEIRNYSPDHRMGLSELPVSQAGERCSRCQRQTQGNRINAFRNIYPPTRNRNASCSGIDVLADAILQTHSKVRGKHTLSVLLLYTPWLTLV